MTATELQQWLNAHGAVLVVDGQPGPKTREAILAVFENLCAASIASAEVDVMAARLGCTARQLRAVAKVESGGAGFDSLGRPKILFERHIFHRLSGGQWTPCGFSMANGGGYEESSWTKLSQAACRDAEAAFSSASWGKFQIMGMHWSALGYPSPLELAYSTVTGEAAHYELLARFIEKFGLLAKLRALSSNPADCAPFAKSYNGVNYRQNRYDEKLAEAMR